MPIKWRSVGRNAKTVAFKLGMPRPKKFPFMNANNSFAKERGSPLYTKQSGQMNPSYVKERGKLKIPRSELIQKRDWHLYRGDLVELTGSHLVDPNNKSFLPLNMRRGKVLEMDYNRNLVRVQGVLQFYKSIPRSLLFPEGDTKTMHRCLYSRRLDSI